METIEAIFYIEGLSSDRKALESAIGEVVQALKKERAVEVIDVNVGDILEADEEPLKYSAIVEARVRGDLKGIVNATMRYAPAIVEVVRPGRMELLSKELMDVLGDVEVFMAHLMSTFGGLAVYPKLDELPEPRVGYSREEIENAILGDRMILYRFVAEVYDEDLDSARKNMAKALSYEGCLINKLVVEKAPEGENKFLLAAEVLSDFETMFQLVAKYVPVALSILEPEVIDVTAGELQNALTDLAGFVHELVTRPLKKKLMDRANTTFKLT